MIVHHSPLNAADTWTIALGKGYVHSPFVPIVRVLRYCEAGNDPPPGRVTSHMRLETPLWTCPRVAHLIEQEFGVRYHEGHVYLFTVVEPFA
jgi:Winged helix-turn helix